MSVSLLPDLLVDTREQFALSFAAASASLNGNFRTVAGAGQSGRIWNLLTLRSGSGHFLAVHAGS